MTPLERRLLAASLLLGVLTLIDPNYGWGPLYSANYFDNSKPPLDPDPAVGPYFPNPPQYPTHWINYRVDVEPDTLVDVSVDYALDENGNVMTHP